MFVQQRLVYIRKPNISILILTVNKKNGCVCIPQLERGRNGEEQQVFVRRTCMSWCCLSGRDLPLHLTDHMGLQYDAAKMPPAKNNVQHDLITFSRLFKLYYWVALSKSLFSYLATSCQMSQYQRFISWSDRADPRQRCRLLLSASFGGRWHHNHVGPVPFFPVYNRITSKRMPS